MTRFTFVDTRPRFDRPLERVRVLVMKGVDWRRGCFYSFIIDEVLSVFGEYEKPDSFFTNTSRNVAKILDGPPFTKGKSKGSSRMHRKLAKALREERSVSLVLLENVNGGDQAREDQLLLTFGTTT